MVYNVWYVLPSGSKHASVSPGCRRHKIVISGSHSVGGSEINEIYNITSVPEICNNNQQKSIASHQYTCPEKTSDHCSKTTTEKNPYLKTNKEVDGFTYRNKCEPPRAASFSTPTIYYQP